MKQTVETKTTEVKMEKKKYWWKATASFLMVLFTMPLGHAVMILMEHFLDETTLHYSAFAMGFVGMLMVIAGVFAKGDTRQTLWGLFGGLLFWTGWVEFLFMYFANRFGTQPELDPVTGEIVTRPEYLILDDGDDYVSVQHTQRMQLHQLVAASAVQGKEERDSRSPDDTPHEHRYLHGADDDSVGIVPAADVLL